MHHGYTRLYRSLWDNEVLQEKGRPFSKREAWLYLVNKEARGTDDPETGLRRGEFDASTRYLAKVWNWPRSNVQRFMATLQANRMIEARTRMNIVVGHPAGHSAGHSAGQVSGHFIISNYDTYNPTRAAPRATRPATFRATSRAKVKEGINTGIKESSNKSSAAPAADIVPAGSALIDQLPSVESFQLSQRLRTAIAKRDPHSRAAKLPDLTHWARDIDKITRLDGRRIEDCEAVIDWCQANPFWGPNILSGRKLREKFDQLYGQMTAVRTGTREQDPDTSWVLDSGREYGAKPGS
jgi:hypothetical protein